MFDQLLAFVAKHARAIPERVVRGLFLAAADAAWATHAGSVRQLERNLVHVTSWANDGAPVDRRELRRLSRRGMRSYFTYFSEAMTVGGRTERQLRARIRGAGDGLDSLVELTGTPAQGGRDGSAPIAMGHQGNWDYAGFWAKFDVAPVVTVAEKLADPDLLKTFVGIRESLGMRILLTGTPKLTSRLEAVLRGPHVIVPLLADRDLGRNGEFVRAFGSVIRVARGPATLAIDAGKPLYVVNMHRERLSGKRRREAGTPYGYVCEVSGPIDVAPYLGMPREEAIAALTQAWVDIWAAGIAAHPEDWHMLQPFFLPDLDLDRLRNVPDWVTATLRADRAGDAARTHACPRKS
ncbi:phosphatidylinositol mannoside acyltransferase [Bifidobacterium choloepi]|uniref:Phosphatidylinositol mannoside acyltransferase n=1 Tax=Bifidobacterium choloepi TaxID=2614131 RepID=A0A6I5NFG3_9BIFI|nr:phosphatidylinositol mannoside acyltransferase [Bifidobacterium choloepi]NEG69103.1 phosphatidylinositol mannoside acyltransferase [Bifidobacterium choloepi]